MISDIGGSNFRGYVKDTEMVKKAEKPATAALIAILFTVAAAGPISLLCFGSFADAEPSLDECLTVDLAVPKNLLARGDLAEVRVEISNICAFDVSDIGITVTAPYFAIPVRSPENIPVNIESGKTVVLVFGYAVVEGGRESFTAEVEKNGETIHASGAVSVSGPGYYRGDSHTHTIYSDGAGKVSDNATEAFDRKMLSWVYTTDHNAVFQKPDTVKETLSRKGMFVNLSGTEFTASNGHALTLGIDGKLTSEESADYLSGGRYGNLEKWQEVVDSTVVERDGIFYLAHPYSSVLGFDHNPLLGPDDTIRDLRRYTGIEIWNGPYNDPGNIRARTAWDKINAQGTGHYSGLTSTDAHRPESVGNQYIKSFLPELTEENINGILKNGSYYGSNGPEVRFSIEGIGLSGTLKITEDITEAVFSINVFSPGCNLVKVSIVKNMVTGNYENNGSIVYDYDFTGEETSLFSKTVCLSVKPGDFYRLEVQSEKSAANPNMQGYAITNNIWVEKAERSNATGLYGVRYDGSGAELKTLPTGIRYFEVADGSTFLPESVCVETSSGASCSMEYDSVSRILSLAITAEDGNRSVTDFFVLEEGYPYMKPQSGVSEPSQMYTFMMVTVAVMSLGILLSFFHRRV